MTIKIEIFVSSDDDDVTTEFNAERLLASIDYDKFDLTLINDSVEKVV